MGRITVVLSMFATLACYSSSAPITEVVGTWGGDDAGLIVTDTDVHIHIGCTLGDAVGPIHPDANGRFEATGTYNVDAYPIDRGIIHPARFTGQITGQTMMLTVSLTDTARVLGPVKLVYGAEPKMGVCPICRTPKERAAEKLGTVHFVTSCNAVAQPKFNRAVALLHSFGFAPAIEGFDDVLKADPQCAMAYWGIALSDWGNPFAAGIKPAAVLERGAEAIRLARTTGAPTERERGYINAAARLYDNSQSLDQPTRLLAYRDAMAEQMTRQPADTEAAIFYALSLAISAPPADKTYASQLKAGAILEKLFAAQPDHPGLAHYIIHAYDVPPLASRALVAARRYSEIAPEAAHALHMPSHTYTRVGYWQKSIDANVASSAVARRDGAGAEELHSSDYRVYAYLQTGQDKAAKQLLDALPEIAKRFDPKAIGIAAPPAAGYFALAAIPVRYALERGDWKSAMGLVVHPSPFGPADAMTHFARAIGAAQLGDTVIPKAETEALQQIRDKLAEQKESYWAEQVEIQRIGASAWLAFAQHRNDDALSAMRNAADREDATEKNAITPGPIAPARELLGAMLLQYHEPRLALKEFEATLVKEPNRFRAVAGAAEAAAAAGDRQAARRYYAQLLSISVRADKPGRRELAEARRYVR